ncbi:hypothetical protein [Deinococcus sonorensis]|uniref:Uncharacterized protein n=1 Tax=Deinococcus sonorensis TaxID=309891 RepID=A0ABV8Y894_9DEIO
MHLINTTGASVDLLTPHGVMTVPPDPRTFSVVSVTRREMLPTGFPVAVRRIQAATVVDEAGQPLPPRRPDVMDLVSEAVRLMLPERRDLLSAGPLITDTHGQPRGYDGLIGN